MIPPSFPVATCRCRYPLSLDRPSLPPLSISLFPSFPNRPPSLLIFFEEIEVRAANPLFDGTLPARTIHSSESLTWTIEYNNREGLLELRECFWRRGDLFIFYFLVDPFQIQGVPSPLLHRFARGSVLDFRTDASVRDAPPALFPF